MLIRKNLFTSGTTKRWLCKKSPHVPVMLNEVIKFLKPQEDQLFIDMTFGAGGHTKHILQEAPTAKVIALDRDPVAYARAEELAKQYPNQIYPILGKFSELPGKLKELNVSQRSIDGMLFDFGCSSMQFDEGTRGFSLSKNGPLDMRMDKDRFPEAPSAADVLAKIGEEDLARILKVYGEEKQAKKIARAIVAARHSVKRLQTTKELADVVQSCFGSDTFRLDKLQRPSHPATKTFQALRIFVNNELNEINYAMILAERYLKIGGRMITICFHSLEDTIVKRHIAGHVIDNMANTVPLKYSSHTICHDKDVMETVMKSNWYPLTKHVLLPTDEEMEDNPRSRSAKLRAAVLVS